jgi:hypothetical protein
MEASNGNAAEKRSLRGTCARSEYLFDLCAWAVHDLCCDARKWKKIAAERDRGPPKAGRRYRGRSVISNNMLGMDDREFVRWLMRMEDNEDVDGTYNEDDD